MEIVKGAWQQFSAHAQAQTTQHPIDRRALPAYAILIPWLVALVLALVFGRFELGKSGYYAGFATMSALLLVGLLARRYHLDRAAMLLETASLPIICGSMTVASTAALSTVSTEFVDHSLQWIDSIFGFKWVKLLSLYQSNPYLYDYSLYAYSSLPLQFIIIPIFLIIHNNDRILWIYANCTIITLALTTLCFPFAPASGPFYLNGIQKQDLHGQVADVNWIVGALIEDLRSGRTRDISTAMTGLVSMPSFHAAAAVILGWVSLYLGWLRIPLVLLNIAMLLSTIITGSHYLIDVIAGSALAASAIWVATRLVDWQHRLQQPSPSPAE